jgi:hypothetical protein
MTNAYGTLDALLKDGRLEEARPLMESLLENAVKEGGRGGAAYLDLASLELGAVNAADQRYTEALARSLGELRQVDEAEADTERRLDIHAIKKELNKFK